MKHDSKTNKQPVKELKRLRKRIAELEASETEHKRAEEELKHVHQVYREVIENAQGIPYRFNYDDSTFEFFGKDCEELIGIHSNEVTKLTYQKFREIVKKRIILDPEAPSDPFEYTKAFQRGEVKRYRADFKIVTPRGEEKWISDCSLPIFDKKTGKVIFSLGILQDITERKRAEEELQKHREHLEEMVRDRTAELEKRVSEVEQLNDAMVNLSEDLRITNTSLESTTQQLIAANNELEAFSYSVSHDLRAPLRAIDGFSGALFEDYHDRLDDEGKRLLNVIRNEAQRMGCLIDDLLTLSRMGRKGIRSSSIDMRELAESVFNELKATAPNRNLQFKIDILPPARGDTSMIRQVFANLLSNAIKFTKTEEVTVIEVAGKVEENENIYYIRDNGIGFDMKYVKKLFGVFQRLHSEEEFEGTGVGLAIAQRIIKRHGGRVWAEGKVNGGATFYFTLPKQGGRHEEAK